MNQFKTYSTILALGIFLTCAFSSCKEEDPWVDAAAAPVLVDIVGAPFGYPQEKQPTVNYDSSAQELVLSARLLELDKTNMLDNTKGIDSIPKANIPIKITYEINKVVKKDTIRMSTQTFIFTADALKANGVFEEVTSDANGLVTLKTSYKTLGFVGNRIQRKGDVIKLTWSGTYNGMSFVRLSQGVVMAK